jgi:hypothetical protein
MGLSVDPIHQTYGIEAPGWGRYDRHQVSQNDQVLDAERTASGGDRDEHVKRRRVGPAKGQRVLDAIVVKEEHPVLTPVVADGEEQELPA